MRGPGRRHRAPAPSARSAATPAVIPPGGYSVASTKFLEALRMCRLSRLLRSCTTKAQTTCGGEGWGQG